MKKLYETDSYIREYETVVTASGNMEDGSFFIELDETIFFPEEGGQNADTGVLTVTGSGHSVRLADGTVRRGDAGREDVIRYIVTEPLETGTRVKCTLDWEQRYDRMQNHSGEHILTGVIHNRYGFDNVGFHLSDSGFVTLDLNGVISYEQVIESEAEANRAIYANLVIRDSYPDKEELKDIEYRSKIDIEGQVRLISIGGTGYKDSLDVCACCAPHVARTGEIGIIKVISVINWKGGIRISMLCGRRALEYINREHSLLSDTARMLSTEVDNVPSMTEQHKKEITELKYRLNEAMKQAVIDRIRNACDDE
ncbi:MAG: alanyl-tRNA editing protein, partial [Lachnospiraceae bacterium]|nr:alanyl-tRNA editing protein [Lachnospiraceae bacterium]